MKIHKKRNTILLIIISCALLLGGCGKEKQTADFSGVTSVCELATLKCYYHNVAKEEIDASGPFAKWFKTGYKKIWTEYSGIIEYGIDVSKVEVSEPDKDGVVTITIPEAEVLSEMQIKTDADMEKAAEIICDTLGCAVLLKGGHQLNDANDLLYQKGKEPVWFEGKRIDNPNTHGTGCTLSSAIASNLAKGRDLETSVKYAKNYISGALAAMLDLGKGSGPMDHAFAIEGEY